MCFSVYMNSMVVIYCIIHTCLFKQDLTILEVNEHIFGTDWILIIPSDMIKVVRDVRILRGTVVVVNLAHTFHIMIENYLSANQVKCHLTSNQCVKSWICGYIENLLVLDIKSLELAGSWLLEVYLFLKFQIFQNISSTSVSLRQIFCSRH